MTDLGANCLYARQVADKERTDVVGCVKLGLKGEGTVDGIVYTGWFYTNAYPGFKIESRTPSEGIMTNGLVVDRNGSCDYHVSMM